MPVHLHQAHVVRSFWKSTGCPGKDKNLVKTQAQPEMLLPLFSGLLPQSHLPAFGNRDRLRCAPPPMSGHPLSADVH